MDNIAHLVSNFYMVLSLSMVNKGRPPLKKNNSKKDDIVRISIYPLPPGAIVTTEKVTNPNNQWVPPSLRK